MKKFLCGALLGAVVAGTVVALTTPKNGPELREDLKKEAVKVKHQGGEVYHKAIIQGEEVLVKVKHQGEDIIDKASKVYGVTHDKAVDAAHNLKDKLPKHETVETVVSEESSEV